MLHGARIAVVVPAYNEARHIAVTLAGVPSFVDDVFVVDDASTDGTAERAAALRDARVRVVRHSLNRGVGGALKTGYRAAFAAGADAVAVMAGDNQMHADDLPALLAPVLAGEADYAKGDRLSHADARGRMPLTRFIGNHVLSSLTRLCTGVRVRDSQCGYTVLGRRAAQRLPLESLWEGYGYPNDLIAALARNGLIVRDVVVRPVYADEISGIGLRHALLVIPFLLVRALARRFTWLGHRASGREGRLENVR
jgi:glycosyltransferase involved in cell wall biosynthesis